MRAKNKALVIRTLTLHNYKDDVHVEDKTSTLEIEDVQTNKTTSDVAGV